MNKGLRDIEIYFGAEEGPFIDGGFPELARIDSDFIHAAKGTWYEAFATEVEPNTILFKVGRCRAIYQLCGCTSTGFMIMRLCASLRPVLGLRFYTYDQELRRKCEVWLNERENQDAKGGRPAGDARGELQQSGGEECGSPEA